jgi:diguanylate cyclase (GGDEF)-like protein
MRFDWRLVIGLVLVAASAIATAVLEGDANGSPVSSLLALCAAIAGAFLLGLQFHAAQAEEERRKIESDALLTALDRVQYGVVLLDPELHARFINRAYRRLWKLPDEAADERPTFSALMHHGGSVNAYPEQRGGIDKYIESRVSQVREGATAPLDIRHNNGEVIRFQCAPLPDGGRMLSYVPVTDLFRSADELRRLATIDGLTGIHNRRHFMELAEAEWSRFQRYHRALSLVMFDIDHFKAVNDRYGHDAGDMVLAEFAKIALDMTRASDVVARIGGEEFAMLLPETNIAAAVAVADRLRRSVEERVIAAGAQTLRITVSAGAAQAIASMSGVARLMKAADEALYAAKHGGRNRVVAAEPEKAGSPQQVAAE